MAVPDYQSCMLPVLRFVASKPTEAISLRRVLEAMAVEFALSESDLKEMLPSGSQTTFANRVNWAGTYMKKAGLLFAPRRAHLQITTRGLEVIAAKPQRIDVTFLKRFPEFITFQQTKGTRSGKQADAADESSTNGEQRTPLEALESGAQSLRSELATELLDRVRNCTPTFFERLVIELIVKMGYGGSRADAGKALGRSGDGGIDGIIKEDRLGLDAIYTQAKRWTDKPVGRPEVQQFQGALSGHGAVKGIFITTSHFTKEAVDYAAGLRNSKIVLIDGEELAELMIDHGIGVATAAVYEVKRVDSDYFDEAE